MRIAHFDCFSGAAGDMILASLVDAGLAVDFLQDLVSKLRLDGVRISAEQTKRHGIAATYLRVEIDASQPAKHRHLHHIVAIIEAAALDSSVAERAKRIFRRLAEAEALVHQTTVEKVHFHEVGAADAIVDIVGACAALRQLNIERITASPLPPGFGTVVCEHGEMPVPAPATALLLRGIPLVACAEPGELVTPTGAAILTTLAEEFGPPPAMRLQAVGVGAGTRQGQTRANILRVLIGEAAAPANDLEQDLVIVLETQLDDADPQLAAFAAERLLEAGALDVTITPIVMKKGRPGLLLTVLSVPGSADRLSAQLLRETPTLGVRRYEARRDVLRREIHSVATHFGEIRVKAACVPGGGWRATPEFDDCAAAAALHNATLAQVRRAALEAWHAQQLSQRDNRPSS